jgi:hypothetical protein
LGGREGILAEDRKAMCVDARPTARGQARDEGETGERSRHPHHKQS